jgi:hypothetical protein
LLLILTDRCLGLDFLPDDKGHGYYGRFLEDDGMETSSSRWWY